jgi:hypothetical protein
MRAKLYSVNLRGIEYLGSLSVYGGILFQTQHRHIEKASIHLMVSCLIKLEQANIVYV